MYVNVRVCVYVHACVVNVYLCFAWTTKISIDGENHNYIFLFLFP